MMLIGIALAGVMATPAFAGETTNEVTVPEAAPEKTKKEILSEWRKDTEFKVNEPMLVTGAIVTDIGIAASFVGVLYYFPTYQRMKLHMEPNVNFDSEAERKADLKIYKRNQSLSYGLTIGGAATFGVGLTLLVQSVNGPFQKWKKHEGYAKLDHSRSWTVTPSVQLVTDQPTFGLTGTW